MAVRSVTWQIHFRHAEPTDTSFTNGLPLDLLRRQSRAIAYVICCLRVFVRKLVYVPVVQVILFRMAW